MAAQGALRESGGRYNGGPTPRPACEARASCYTDFAKGRLALQRNYLDERLKRSAARVASLAALYFLGVTAGFAQNPPAPAPGDEPAGAAPPPAPAAPSGKRPSEKNKDAATSSAPDQPVWDPARAEKDIKVGHFYMDKGDVDAAIDRFEDATVAKPGYALPFLYLGEAHEKKGQKRLAAKAYRRYLDLSPHAEDAAKVQKKIDRLYKELEKDREKDK
jgi:tetratricopeptide (TPR) repeat protein